jgi:hypothetical protein
MFKTHRLHLKLGELLEHYFMAGVMCIISIMSIYFVIQDLSGNGIKTKTTIDLFVVGLIAMGIQTFVFITRYNELRFKPIHTNLPDQQIEHLMVKTANENQWYIMDKGSGYMVAERNGAFGTGERITILFKDGLVLLNCICKPTTPSLTSFGYNKKNRLIIESILHP